MSQDIIARLSQFVPIRFDGQCNFIDAAIARTSPALVDKRIVRPGGILQLLSPPAVQPVLNTLVQKSGRTTEFRRGLISAVTGNTFAVHKIDHVWLIDGVAERLARYWRDGGRRWRHRLSYFLRTRHDGRHVRVEPSLVEPLFGDRRHPRR
ncbi:MAG: hypothetical protein ACM3ZF_13980 [Mycobacterium leprae]